MQVFKDLELFNVILCNIIITEFVVLFIKCYLFEMYCKPGAHNIIDI